MSEELKDMIVKELIRHRSRNDILQAVCEQGGLKWPEAEGLVQQVQTERAHAIARGQIPLMALLSAATVAAGVFILNDAVQFIWDIFHGGMLAQIMLLGTGYYPLSLGITGLAMIAGGMIGMWKTLSRYFET